MICHCAEYHYAECGVLFFMLNVIMLNVIILTVIMLNVVILSVVAHKTTYELLTVVI